MTHTEIKKSFRLLTSALVGSALLLAGGLLFALASLDSRRTNDIQTLQEKTTTSLRTAQATDAYARYDSGLTACARGNQLRARQASLISITKAVNVVLVEFLETSAAFRKSAGQTEGAAQSLRAQSEISRLNRTLAPLPQVICQDVIPLPTVARPQPR